MLIRSKAPTTHSGAISAEML